MIREVGVVIPARDEQQRIGACLRALARSRARLRELRPEIRVRTVVVLDRCTDGTGAVANAHGVPTLRVGAGSVGVARAAGSAHLLADAHARVGELWLASTDADSTVPPGWLAGMVEFAEQGSDLVIGTALPMPGLAPALERGWLAAHVLRDGHPHVHGANLGISADAYRAAGGWPHLATGEDERLVERALAAGARPTRTSAYPVRTSTRFTARAPRGFSSYLRGLAAALSAAPEDSRPDEPGSPVTGNRFGGEVHDRELAAGTLAARRRAAGDRARAAGPARTRQDAPPERRGTRAPHRARTGGGGLGRLRAR